MCLVTLRPMFALGEYLASATATKMRGYTLSLAEDLYRRRCRSHFHQLVNQRVGHAVEVGVEGDVVIDVYPCPGPLAHVERFGRQRSQCVAFERSEHTSTRSFALPGRSRRHAIVLRVRLALGE